MEHEKHNPHGNKSFNRKFLNKKFLIFTSFLFVIGIILVSVFPGNLSLTGKSISSINSNNSISISAELTIPELELKGDYEKVTFFGRSSSSIYIGNKKFALERTLNEIILNGFSGKININESKILLVDGKASEVILNGIPISNKNNNKIKIYTNSEIFYDLIEFEGNTYVKEMDYIASGRISFGEKIGDKIHLDEKELFISHFFGQLKIKSNRMFLNGLVDKIEIKDETSKVVISY